MVIHHIHFLNRFRNIVGNFFKNLKMIIYIFTGKLDYVKVGYPIEMRRSKGTCQSKKKKLKNTKCKLARWYTSFMRINNTVLSVEKIRPGFLP